MTSPLDGPIRQLFGAVFGAIMLPGWLYRAVLTDDGKGGVTRTWAAPVQVRGQRDTCTEAMRQAAGYTATDAALIILQHGVSIPPTTDDEIQLAGKRWGIYSVEQDPAGSNWVLHGFEIVDGTDAGPTDTGAV